MQEVTAEGEDLLAGKPLALHVLPEGLPVAQVLHGVVWESPGRSGAEHPHDVGVPEISQNAGFGEEAVDGLCGGKLRPDDLDGHEPVEGRLARHEHRAHAAARDLAQQLVALWTQGLLKAFEVRRHRMAIPRQWAQTPRWRSTGQVVKG